MFGINSPQRTIKTFVLEKQDTHQSDLVEKEINTSEPFIDLSELFELYSPPSEHTIFIYDPNANQFKTLQKIGIINCIVPQKFLQPTFVLIKYRKKNLQNQDESNILCSGEEQGHKNKDIRSKERTLAEVIALVKHWRNLHLSAPKPGNPKKRMNLQQAAKQVGVSKKSLDDYYCQLRLGELHNFNFAENMGEKIGKLRIFVKQHRVDQSVRIRHHKHPKSLNIIEQFHIDQKMEEFIMRQREQAFNEFQMMKEESNHLLLQENNILNEKFEPQFLNIENSFMNNFQFLMDEPSDPFLFKKNDFKINFLDSESQQMFFH